MNIQEYKYHQTRLGNHCDTDWESPEILDAGELEERYEHAVVGSLARHVARVDEDSEGCHRGRLCGFVDVDVNEEVFDN